MAERSAPPAAGRLGAPTLHHERALLRAGSALVAGVDEVGRGALAGPVSVGVVVVGPGTRSAPAGLRDSKLLTPAAREALVPPLRRWAGAWAVGHASAGEVDALGVLRALRLAGGRALADLAGRADADGGPVLPSVVLLDGDYDWLTRPAAPDGEAAPPPPVVTRVKADLRCSAVAAASVLAKTTRDALMVAADADHPGYGWAANKGYSAPDHLAALARRGPCALHRRSWRLPGAARCMMSGDER